MLDDVGGQQVLQDTDGITSPPGPGCGPPPRMISTNEPRDNSTISI
jgi:hypothetical protein